MLSKTVRKRTAEIVWGDEIVAQVHALDPKDVADILVEMGQDVAGVFSALDEVDDLRTAMARAQGNPEDAADQIMQALPQVLVAFRKHLPNVLAKIVATAAGEPEEWEYVRDNYDVMLQFLILGEIARVTFVSVDGFRMFAGNVVALVETVSSLTNAKNLPNLRGSAPSSVGITPY